MINSYIMQSLLPFFPEMFLLTIAIFIQLISVLFNIANKKLLTIIFIIAHLFIAAIMILTINENNNYLAYNNYRDFFEVTKLTQIVKIIIAILTALSIWLYYDYAKPEYLIEEFSTLLTLSSLGIFLAISARHLILLFCALEMQALVSYTLVCLKMNNEKPLLENNKIFFDLSFLQEEAAIKYFIFGAIFSLISLFGISYFYGFSNGYFTFTLIEDILQSADNMQKPIIFSIIFILAGFLFKSAVFPFHFWNIDIFATARAPAIMYISIVQKFGIVIVLLNFFTHIIGNYHSVISIFIKIIAIASMLFGSIGGLRQNSLKKLLAYSTILNMGYLLIPIILSTQKSYLVTILYMIIYALSFIGLLASLLKLFGTMTDSLTFEGLKNIANRNKFLALVISLFSFSLIGIPPLAGFFVKYYIFLESFRAGEYLLISSALLASIISAFYYLKIIRFMYFEKESQTIDVDFEKFYLKNSHGLSCIIFISILGICLFSFLPIDIVEII